MKNQRLKLIQTMKKRSSRKTQNMTLVNDPYSHTQDYTLNYDSHPTSRQSRRLNVFKHTNDELNNIGE